MPNARAAGGAGRDGGRAFRIRRTALPTLATVLAIVVFAWAGKWQGSRMHEKEALRAQLDAASAANPIALDALPSNADWGALRYRPVTVAGDYDARRQILVDNKVHAGRAGFHVVTPLTLADGRAVLVNRGWVAPGPSRTVLPEAPPPPGTVTVRGRLAVPAVGYFELAPETAPGQVWQNLDPRRFAAATGRPVLPVVVEATVPPVPDDGLVRDWPAPDFGVEKHRIYMLQWYALAALAAGLWLLFFVRRWRGVR